MDQEFRVSEQFRGGTSVVTVAGEVDVATAPALRDCLDQAVRRAEGAVVVDLLGVTFIDSTGLGVLIGAQRGCAEDGRELQLVIAEPRILKVFEITGLTELFPIVATLEESADGTGGDGGGAGGAGERSSGVEA